MKATFILAGLLLTAGYVHADCVATNSSAAQLCSMVTDQADCLSLSGLCEWQGATTPPPGAGTCSGSSPYCSILTSQQDCSMIAGCNWN